MNIYVSAGLATWLCAPRLDQRTILGTLAGAAWQVVVLFVAAWLAAALTVDEQQELVRDSVDVLEKSIRTDMETNLRTMKGSVPRLDEILALLAAYIDNRITYAQAGVTAGYGGLATTGLQTILSHEGIRYVGPNMLTIYTFVHDRLVRSKELKILLDMDVNHYNSALTDPERLRAARQLHDRVTQKLAVDRDLIELLDTLLQCWDTFPEEDVCDLGSRDSPEAKATPAREPQPSPEQEPAAPPS